MWFVLVRQLWYLVAQAVVYPFRLLNWLWVYWLGLIAGRVTERAKETGRCGNN